MRTLLTFSTPEYDKQAARLNDSANPFFDQIVHRKPRDIPLDYRRSLASHFDCRRGFALWVWKPLFVLRELESMGVDDVLVYADSSVVFEADPAPLFELARRHDGIGIFHQKREGHKNGKWTRGECFRRMGCDGPDYRDGDNLATTYSVWTKTKKSLAFLREWLRWCEDLAVVGDGEPGEQNYPEFKDHRHDQSIASLLAIRDKLFTLCDCSQFGDGHRCDVCRYGRILTVDRRVVAPWLARPAMSSIVEISALATCPLRCTYCPQDKLGQAYTGPEMLSLETLDRCLGHLIPGDAIYFAGFTEPCLNPAIVEMLEMCLARGHRTRLYTTGRGLDDTKAATISALGLEELYLHLPDAAGHLKHCERTVAILDQLAQHPAAKCMAMDNEPHPAVAHLWERLARGTGAMHDRAGNVTAELTVQKKSIGGGIKCGAAPGLDHPVLLPDGRLSLCCMDYGLRHIVGDLAAQPLATILRDEPLKQIRELQRAGSDVLCRNCVCAVPA